VLTEAGVVFQGEALQIIASTERARAAALRAAHGETGRLRVGFTGSAAFNPVVSATIRNFRRTWASVRLILEEANTMHLLEGLARQTLDAAFIRPGISGLDGIRLKRFDDERMKVVLPSSHPLAGHSRIPLSALANAFHPVPTCCRS
jgi:DNA-binding transcriptional LysR family regulator